MEMKRNEYKILGKHGRVIIVKNLAQNGDDIKTNLVAGFDKMNWINVAQETDQ